MDKELQNSFQHFTDLKSKYHASRYEDSSLSSLLYLILQKVDLSCSAFKLGIIKSRIQ
ncbi:hypothetical protein NIES4106_17460 [Fischerella sp. NIES-4106]|nr:hypothetical protein NIES4106_17460 [Fischerella sp. NIES-4106]